MSIDVIILAAGQGSRMKSSLPKVLHPIAGKPMLGHVIDSAKAVGADKLHVVVGHGADAVKAQFSDQSELSWSLQSEQLGTGHAVQMALDKIAHQGVTLILYGDVPLIKSNTLTALINQVSDSAMSLLTVNMTDPTGYGRIVRNKQDQVVSIIEHKDASDKQRQIPEVNTGILALPSHCLHDWLPKLSNDNAQGEYYLTDIIAMAVDAGIEVNTLQPAYAEETFGVNNRKQQAELERWHQLQLCESLMAQGVTLMDPSRTDIRGQICVGKDVVIDTNVMFEGNVVLADNVIIEPNCVIKNADIGAGTRIKAFSHIDGAQIQAGCDIGPYARLRPGAHLHDAAKVGNFCEVKKSTIGQGSKVNHLTYIGDAEVGQNVNVGAGTITCNYDGVNKFKTEIGDDVFIGSNTSLVAPVKVGAGATVGAGSTITKEVEPNRLGVARGRQKNLDWTRPKKT